MRNKISQLLIKYSMPTRQPFINDLMRLYQDKIDEAWEESLKHSRLSVGVSVKEARAVFDRKFNQSR